jgi:hypothetical protein
MTQEFNGLLRPGQVFFPAVGSGEAGCRLGKGCQFQVSLLQLGGEVVGAVGKLADHGIGVSIPA